MNQSSYNQDVHYWYTTRKYVNLIITESSEIMFFTQKLYPAMNELNCNRVIQRYCAVSSSEDVFYGKIPQSLVAARFVFKTV